MSLSDYLDRVADVWDWLAQHPTLHGEPAENPQGLSAYRRGYAEESRWAAARARQIPLAELRSEARERRARIPMPPMDSFSLTPEQQRDAGRREALVQLELEILDWMQEGEHWDMMLDAGRRQAEPADEGPSWDEWHATHFNDYDVWVDTAGRTHVRRLDPTNS